MSSLFDAYSVVSRLGAEGFNVSSLVDLLNRALELETRGSNASSIVSEVISYASSMSSYNPWGFVVLGLVLGFVVVVGVVLYFRGRDFLGLVWFWFRRGFRVRLGSGVSRGFFDEEVLGVVLSVVVVVVVFSVAYSLRSGGESFSAIAVLGPGMRIGDYPRVVLVGEPVGLYLYVYNHMGRPIWFVVRSYLVDSRNESSLLFVNQRILVDNGTWVFPVTFSINSTGMYRFVAELWYYDPVSLNLTYTGNYVQLLLNSTGVGYG